MTDRVIGGFADKSTCNHVDGKAIIGGICRLCGTLFGKILQPEAVQAIISDKKPFHSRIRTRGSKVRFPNHNNKG